LAFWRVSTLVRTDFPGSWTGEACCSGTLTVSGTIASDSIHVQIARSGAAFDYTYSFDGILLSRTQLVGMATRTGVPPQVEHLQKL